MGRPKSVISYSENTRKTYDSLLTSSANSLRLLLMGWCIHVHCFKMTLSVLFPGFDQITDLRGDVTHLEKLSLPGHLVVSDDFYSINLSVFV